MAWITLDPVTRKRLHRFRQIKRGWWSFLILMAAILLSIFAPYLAESRALLVWYQGQLHFPTFRYIEMSRFGQASPPDWSTSEIEVDYFRLQREWETERFMHARERAAAVAAGAAGADSAALAAIDARYPNRDHFVVMPPIPWDPYQNDFWANEILHEIQHALGAGRPEVAERLARRDRLHEPADAIHEGRLAALLADPAKSANGTLVGLARSGAVPSIAHLGQAPPNAPDADRRHYLGTDAQGRNVAARLLYGFRPYDSVVAGFVGLIPPRLP